MNALLRQELKERALRIRRQIIGMSVNGGCYIGSAFSCVDILVYLYGEVLRLSPATVNDPRRDYFFLSKGHAVPALYGALAEFGYIEKDRLKNHLAVKDSIYWHPNRSVAGIEFHSGSLGHILPVAVGVCLDIKLRKGTSNVYVLLGDGELNEGSIWEAALVAAARRFDNLVVIIDRNELQANCATESLVPLEPIDWKFRAFGWNVHRLDGHCFDQLEDAFVNRPFEEGKPRAVIAKTVRGKGLPSIERRADRWFINASSDEAASMLRELEETAVVTSTANN